MKKRLLSFFLFALSFSAFGQYRTLIEKDTVKLLLTKYKWSTDSATILALFGGLQTQVTNNTNNFANYLPTSGGIITNGISPNANGTIALGNGSNNFANVYANNFQSSSVLTLHTLNGNSIDFSISGIQKMRLQGSTGFLGIGTTSPTHTVTLDSTRAQSGIALYNTSDLTTNYERFRIYFASNTINFSAESGGTGPQRNIAFTTVGSIASNSGSVVLNNGYISASSGRTFTTVNPVSTATSGAGNFFGVFGTANQGGTAGYRALYISPYEQATGTGTKYLIDAGTNTAANGSGTHTSKFTVDNSGAVNSAISYSLNTLSALNFSSTTLQVAPSGSWTGIALMRPTSIAGNFQPGTDASYDLGVSGFRFRDFNLSRNATVGGTLNLTNFNSANLTGLTNTLNQSISLSNPFFAPFGMVWHDLFRFSKVASPIQEKSDDGTTWTSQGLFNQLFAGQQVTGVAVIDTTITNGTVAKKAVRWTWNSASLGFGLGTWLVIGHAYNAVANNKTILFESSADGITWTTRHTSSYATNADNVFHYLNQYGGDLWLRLTITLNSGVQVNLSNIQLLTYRPGNQGFGKEYEYPYAWDGSQNVAFGQNGSANSAIRLLARGIDNTTSNHAFRAADNSGNALFNVRNDGAVSVGTSSPATSAKLDVNSTTQGFLPPRMTQAQRNAIASPTAGLVIYCTDCTATDASTGTLQGYNGSTWKNAW